MAKRVVKAGFLSINAVDYTSQVASVSLAIEGPEVDVTTYSSAGWNEFLQGMKGFQMDVDFRKDDGMALDSALWAIFIGSTGVTPFEVRVTSGSVSATNPKFTGSIVITQWNPAPGALNSPYGGQVSWRGTGAVTRAEA